MTEPRERIAGFHRALERRLSTRVERCRYGTAYLHEGFPRRWDSNFVWADAPMEGVSARELAADVDDVLERAGLSHRMLWVGDLEHAERLAPGLAELGYRVDRNVVMIHAREPDRWSDERAQEIELEPAKRFFREVNVRSRDVDDPADARMLADFRDVLVERAGARFFGALVDGEVVSGCELYPGGNVAQIEDVVTLAEHQGQGLARAVVLAAVRAAREGGADLVFLVADDQDWPKHLYVKLGFDEVGRTVDFVRKPGVEPAHGSGVGSADLPASGDPGQRA